jgi:hypothetical protein
MDDGLLFADEGRLVNPLSIFHLNGLRRIADGNLLFINNSIFINQVGNTYIEMAIASRRAPRRESVGNVPKRFVSRRRSLDRLSAARVLLVDDSAETGIRWKAANHDGSLSTVDRVSGRWQSRLCGSFGADDPIKVAIKFISVHTFKVEVLQRQA